ncbi:PilZ domain-containing protein [bacterium]|nr:PilZ domain-containing protein [bacterium]
MKFNLDIDSINYIKIVFTDKYGHAHYTKAAIKQMGEKEILACAKFQDGLKLNTPQEVTISFVCDNGLYRTKTNLKYISVSYEEDTYVYFTLQTPEGIEYQQNREYFRVKLEENVILFFKQSDLSFQRIECKTHDISANGVRIEFNSPINIPENVQLNILFEKRNIKTNARLIRTETANNLFRAAFKFVNISEQDMDYISQVCIKKQLEYKRNQFG